MAKKQRRVRQPDRDARRRAKLKARGGRLAQSSGGHSGPLWSDRRSDDLDGLDLSMPELDWETEKAHCPVADRCAGCGAEHDLQVMLSAFSGGDVACVTVCPRCDGKSMIQLADVGLGGVDARVAAHSAHRSG